MGKLAINGGKKAVVKTLKQDPSFSEMIEEQVSAVSELVRKRQISRSATVNEFEKEWSDYLGVDYSLAQCNGTSTLHAAYFAVIKEMGDEIIAPVHTHLSVASIITAGGVPVFCDIDPLTLNMDPEQIEEKITSRTKAISVTHCYGHPADMDKITGIAKKHGLAVIEDCSHAHGAEYKNKKVGSIGDIGCFSLQGYKLMTGGEAGMFSTGKAEHYERAIMLGHFERMHTLQLPEYQPYQGGGQPAMNVSFKYRVHPLAIALARVEMKYLESRRDMQMKSCDYLNEALKNIEGFDGPFIAPYATKVTWLNYLLRFYPESFKGIGRRKVIDALKAEGLSDSSTGRAGYTPLVRQSLLQADIPSPCSPLWDHYLRRAKDFTDARFPRADQALEERISISNFRDMLFDEEYLRQVVDAFDKVSKYRNELI